MGMELESDRAGVGKMRETKLSQDLDGLLSWIQIGIGLSFIIVASLGMYFLNKEGFFSVMTDAVSDFTSIFNDGENLGEWLGGIFTGILTALWNFGVSVGTGIWGDD